MIRLEIPEPKPRNRQAWATFGRSVVVLVGLGMLFLLFVPSHYEYRRRGRPPCKNNLKQIGLALHNYHDTYKCLPPAFVRGPDGKPWHSWRVLILPFLEQQPLAEKYRFDEPWNGPNNSKLLDQRPEAFACRQPHGAVFAGVVNVPKRQTSYVAVVGPETAWPGTPSIQFRDITDGLSNTVLVIEVRNASIPWTAPDDLSFEEGGAPPTDQEGRRPSSVHTGGGNVLLGDGTVRFLNTTLSSEIWRALLTRSGGETINDF